MIVFMRIDAEVSLYMAKNIRTLSLFSGGGGLDIGFEKAGFNILFATDFDHACCETLKLNAGLTLSSGLIVVEEDINKLDLEKLPANIDMVIGGPPCQSFSASGRRAGGAAGKLDQRGNLFISYCKVLEKVRPKAFLFENVRGILGTNKGRDFKDILDAFSKLGYSVDYRILDAEDYGVPQQRERLFIVGHKLDFPFLFPRPVYGPDSPRKNSYISVKDAIEGVSFTEQDREETLFEGGKYSDLLPLVPPGSNYLHFTAKRGYPTPIFAYRSRFSDFLYKANPATPVKTLIASPGKYTGPLHWDNRYLTVAEYKRIQGFPDNHMFYGDRASQIRQIGNSVCPKIAHYLAMAIREQVFCCASEIEYLHPDDKLSFDKRKGEKAQKTRKKHQKVLERNESEPHFAFELYEYEASVTPNNLGKAKNLKVKVRNDDHIELVVRSDSCQKIQAKMKLIVFDGIARNRKISVDVIVKGQNEFGVQTMWNAVDNWVKHASHFHSLLELYGHFTEPHPMFEVYEFDVRCALPIFHFAKHSASFSNCSVYFLKEQLTHMWKDAFNGTDFLSLAQKLRDYRFDIRCHETNIAIPQGVYMVAYPFALPYDKQMNFMVKEVANG